MGGNILFAIFKNHFMALQYTLIKSEKQYFKYCDEVEALLELKKRTKEQEDLIDLLTLLIEKYDDDHDTSEDLSPVELIKYLMQENKIKPVNLAQLLGISKSLMSDILNYRRALSKTMVRKLAERFKMQQEAFNRPYWLKVSSPKRKKKKSLKPA
jgi:HTH-type transcriptional regulator / antitoxin HigA